MKWGTVMTDLGKVSGLKTVRMSISKIDVSLGIQDTPKVFSKIVFGLVNLFPINEGTGLDSEQVITPINPLGKLNIHLKQFCFLYS